MSDTPSSSKTPKQYNQKVILITPEQIAKMGLTSTINSALLSQLEKSTSKTPESKAKTQSDVKKISEKIAKNTAKESSQGLNVSKSEHIPLEVLPSPKHKKVYSHKKKEDSISTLSKEILTVDSETVLLEDTQKQDGTTVLSESKTKDIQKMECSSMEDTKTEQIVTVEKIPKRKVEILENVSVKMDSKTVLTMINSNKLNDDNLNNKLVNLTDKLPDVQENKDKETKTEHSFSIPESPVKPDWSKFCLKTYVNKKFTKIAPDICKKDFTENLSNANLKENVEQPSSSKSKNDENYKISESTTSVKSPADKFLADLTIENQTNSSTTDVSLEEKSDVLSESSKEETLPDFDKPTPKKRGRKRKSEMVTLPQKKVVEETKTIEYATSRSGRKRKVINYASLNSGDDVFLEPVTALNNNESTDSPVEKIRRKSLSLPEEESSKSVLKNEIKFDDPIRESGAQNTSLKAKENVKSTTPKLYKIIKQPSSSESAKQLKPEEVDEDREFDKFVEELKHLQSEKNNAKKQIDEEKCSQPTNQLILTKVKNPIKMPLKKRIHKVVPSIIANSTRKEKSNDATQEESSFENTSTPGRAAFKRRLSSPSEGKGEISTEEINQNILEKRLKAIESGDDIKNKIVLYPSKSSLSTDSTTVLKEHLNSEANPTINSIENPPDIILVEEKKTSVTKSQITKKNRETNIKNDTEDGDKSSSLVNDSQLVETDVSVEIFDESAQTNVEQQKASVLTKRIRTPKVYKDYFINNDPVNQDEGENISSLLDDSKLKETDKSTSHKSKVHSKQIIDSSSINKDKEIFSPLDDSYLKETDESTPAMYRDTAKKAEKQKSLAFESTSHKTKMHSKQIIESNSINEDEEILSPLDDSNLKETDKSDQDNNANAKKKINKQKTSTFESTNDKTQVPSKQIRDSSSINEDKDISSVLDDDNLKETDKSTKTIYEDAGGKIEKQTSSEFVSRSRKTKAQNEKIFDSTSENEDEDKNISSLLNDNNLKETVECEQPNYGGTAKNVEKQIESAIESKILKTKVDTKHIIESSSLNEDENNDNKTNESMTLINEDTENIVEEEMTPVVRRKHLKPKKCQKQILNNKSENNLSNEKNASMSINYEVKENEEHSIAEDGEYSQLADTVETSNISMPTSNSHETETEDSSQIVNEKNAEDCGTEQLLEKKKQALDENTLNGMLIRQYIDRMKRIRNGEESFPENFYLNHDVSNETNILKCGFCKEVMPKKKYANHKVRHNQIAWLEGQEPVDFNDVVKIFRILNKVRTPQCEICRQKKKSLVGYLSHFVLCSLSKEEMEKLKISCKICNLRFFPPTLVTHMVSHKKDQKEKPKPAIATVVTTCGKRAAAVKALNLMEEISKSEKKDLTVFNITKNFNYKSISWMEKTITDLAKEDPVLNCVFNGCEYSSEDKFQYANHLFICIHKPLQNFVCNKCLKPFKEQTEAQNHIQEHVEKDNDKQVEISSDEAEDDVKFIGKKQEDKHSHDIVNTLSFLNPVQRNKGKINNLVLDWQKKFCADYFSVQNLFLKFKSKPYLWSPLEPNQIRHYLPKLKVSIDMGITNLNKAKENLENTKTKRMKLFETIIADRNASATIFVGGPVKAIAWLPTPYEKSDCDQIVAVSVLDDPEVENTLHRGSKQTLIQFWNFGPLKNSKKIPDPKLEFCITHDFGTPHHLEWCPSGCYDLDDSDSSEVRRLGLLAVASPYTSDVLVYCILNDKNSNCKVFKPKPVLKLSFNIKETRNLISCLNVYPSKISWSKAKFHNTVAVGYSNGMIAIFDIENDNPLLISKDEQEIDIIKPRKVFHAHIQTITILSFLNFNGTSRWLISYSYDKSLKYWDLEHCTDALVTYKHNVSTDGGTLNHWLSVFLSEEESATYSFNPTKMVYFRHGDKGNPYNLLHGDSSVLASSGNDWANMISHGTISGDVCCSFYEQFAFNKRHSKSRPNKFVASHIKLLNKDKNKANKNSNVGKTGIDAKFDTQFNQYSYYDCDKNLSIVFCDMDVKHRNLYFKSMRPRSKNRMIFDVKSNIYTLKAVNKVAFNPNLQSHFFLACGYQAGFLRLNSVSL